MKKLVGAAALVALVGTFLGLMMTLLLAYAL
jgi:hypothetical protein